jgi:sortase A
METNTILSRIGMFLLVVGVLLIAFVAFQLWGTALYTDHVQGNLKTQLGHEIHHSTLNLNSLRSAKPGADPKGSSLPRVATSVAPTTGQPAIGQPIGLLAIPKLGLDDALVQGTGESQLQGGPGHYQGTALPGQAGNAAVAGHRTTFAAPFYDLNELSPGDPIFVLTSQGLFRYDVRYTQIVSPSDTAVLDDSTTPELTLTTCNPRYSASQRLVVVAFLDTTSTPATTTQKPPSKSVPPSSGSKTATKTTSPTETLSSLADGSIGRGPILPALLWAIGTLILAIAVYFGAKRLHRPFTWIAYVVGVPLVLLALFICFEHVSLALPASF